MAAVARAHSAKKANANANPASAAVGHNQADSLELPHFVSSSLDDTIDEGDLPSPAMETSVYAGCCGGREPFLLIRRRNNAAGSGGKGSYSALDTCSSEGGDEDSAEKSQKSVSDCVKNLVHWVSAVGGRVNKGTSALIDAIPCPSAIAMRGEDHHVVMIGLDSAGKTTVLYRLKFDQYVNTAPTIGFNCERVRAPVTVESAVPSSDGGTTTTTTRMMNFQVWDVGGQEKARPLWRPYTRATDAIVFVVDSCDEDRMEEAKLELHRYKGLLRYCIVTFKFSKIGKFILRNIL